MLVIDGSQGEGGGQVLRTSLSLSALTGRPFIIKKIRANRSKPGLRPQHLTAVRAVAAICLAEMEGDRLESTELTFRPTTAPAGGAYDFDVRQASPSGVSAGAVTLILQAILWPLLFAERPSIVVLRGGTFVPFSPAYHYLAHVIRPAFAAFGIELETELQRWGWMAGGGGIVQVQVNPCQQLKAVRFEAVDDLVVGGIAGVTNLPSHIPHRMARRAHNLLAAAGYQPAIEAIRERSDGPGAGIVLWRPQAGFSNLGRKGLPSEEVAQAAVADFIAFMDNGAAVDRYLADQLLIPMALARGKSSFTTDTISRHLLTNVQLLRQWLETSITIQDTPGQLGRVSVTGSGHQSIQAG
ncbi:MAG: RNA 3'-terminal phosphate cyclase [Chloroflexota bacterium]|jgi:RNA 3'-terminal phosphate cyclase (ATP)